MTGKDDKNLPYDLENLSIPELEALLQQDFLASDSSSPDADYIMAIVEVIHKKERALPDYQPLDTAKAWEEFKSFYITEKGRANSIYCPDEKDEEKPVHLQAAQRPPKHKQSKIIRRCLLAAASLCLLKALTCIPIFGYHSIVQMLASWTAVQFGFYMPPDTRSVPEQIPEEFAELQEIMDQLGAKLIIPKFPGGFVAEEPSLDYFPNSDTLQFSIMYWRESDYYVFVIDRNDHQTTSLHEKSNSLVETKVYDGIEHYYFENMENRTVAWHVDTTEYYIVTNRTISDLKEILELTYDE